MRHFICLRDDNITYNLRRETEQNISKKDICQKIILTSRITYFSVYAQLFFGGLVHAWFASWYSIPIKTISLVQ